jgi:hypothetical protein
MPRATLSRRKTVDGARLETGETRGQLAALLGLDPRHDRATVEAVVAWSRGAVDPLYNMFFDMMDAVPPAVMRKQLQALGRAPLTHLPAQWAQLSPLTKVVLQERGGLPLPRDWPQLPAVDALVTAAARADRYIRDHLKIMGPRRAMAIWAVVYALALGFWIFNQRPRATSTDCIDFVTAVTESVGLSDQNRSPLKLTALQTLVARARHDCDDPPWPGASGPLTFEGLLTYLRDRNGLPTFLYYVAFYIGVTHGDDDGIPLPREWPRLPGARP